MVTFGFYNSLNGDRKYNTEDINRMFDGIITSGVYYNIGDRLMVTHGSGMRVNVGSGRAWLNHTWTYNDGDLSLTIDNGDVLYSRIDTICLEIDTRTESRTNSIKILKGTPSANPVKPTLINDGSLFQYSLADITVDRGVTAISNANIKINVGEGDLAYVTGVLQALPLNEYTARFEQMFENFMSASEEEFNTWFNYIKGKLTEDQAGNLLTLCMELEANKLDKGDVPNSIPDAGSLLDLVEGITGLGVDTTNIQITAPVTKVVDKLYLYEGRVYKCIANAPANITTPNPTYFEDYSVDGVIARVKAESPGYPDYSTGEVVVLVTNTPTTVNITKDCWFGYQLMGGAGAGILSLSVNGHRVITKNTNNGNYTFLADGILPLKAGDVVVLSGWSYGSLEEQKSSYRIYDKRG